MRTKRNEYKSLDLFKFIFAILVVMIHAKPLLDVSDKANWFFSNSFLNLAVPFFFITSGFLLFEKLKSLSDDADKKTAVKKYVGHLLKLYLIWSIIWLPLKLLGWHTSGGIGKADLLSWIQAFFLTGKTGDAIWYLLAVSVSAVVAAWITRNGEKNFKLLLIISGLLYVLGVLMSSWYKVLEGNFVVEWYYKIFLTTENGLLNGLLFFAIGAFISKYGFKISSKTALICAAIGFCVLVGEVILVYNMQYNKDGVCKLFTLPIVSMLLFLGLVQLPVNIATERCRTFRDWSTLIYVSHGMIIRILGIMVGIVGLKLPYSVLFIMTILLAWLFAIIIRYLTKNKNVKILKALY